MNSTLNENYKKKYLKYKLKYIKLKNKQMKGGMESAASEAVSAVEEQTKKAEFKKLIDYIKQKKITVPFINITNYLNVSMGGGIHSSELPVATNGIATCMGIGTHIDGKNYFSHASMYEYTSQQFINDWKKLLEDNIEKITYVYLYTPYGICIESLPFLNMLIELNLKDKIILVQTTIFNTTTKKYTSEWNPKFKVGIYESGPWCYEYP